LQDHQPWLERWENNRIGFHEAQVNPYLKRYIDYFGLARGASVFVPLCGKSLDLYWLWQQGFEVSGIELSPLAVQQFFNEQELSVEVAEQGPFQSYQTDRFKLLCGDFFQLSAESLSQPQWIYDRAALIALPTPLRAAYMKKMREQYPGVAQLLITLEYDQALMSGPPFSVGMDEVQALYGDAYRIEVLNAVEQVKSRPQFLQRGLKSLMERAISLLPV